MFSNQSANVHAPFHCVPFLSWHNNYSFLQICFQWIEVIIFLVSAQRCAWALSDLWIFRRGRIVRWCHKVRLRQRKHVAAMQIAASPHIASSNTISKMRFVSGNFLSHTWFVCWRCFAFLVISNPFLSQSTIAVIQLSFTNGNSDFYSYDKIYYPGAEMDNLDNAVVESHKCLFFVGAREQSWFEIADYVDQNSLLHLHCVDLFAHVLFVDLKRQAPFDPHVSLRRSSLEVAWMIS